MNLISIVTPIKNGSKLFKTTYKSVINRQYKNFEWIIVDDGSNSTDLDEIKRIINDSRIKFICSNINNGPGAARNIGLSYIS